VLVEAPQTNAARSAIESTLANLGVNRTVSLWSDTSWLSLMLGSQIWGIVLIAVSTFTFMIICIGLTSLVYSAMLSRVRDFAVLKTVGASAGSLRWMHLGDLLVQYAIGYLAGVILAMAVVGAVNLLSITSTNAAFTFVVGSTMLSFVPTW